MQRHPFFRPIKWPALLAKQLPPPFVPHVAGPLDVSHIDKRYTDDEAAVDSPTLGPVLSPTKSELFGSFTWKTDSPPRFLVRRASRARARTQILQGWPKLRDLAQHFY